MTKNKGKKVAAACLLSVLLQGCDHPSGFSSQAAAGEGDDAHPAAVRSAPETPPVTVMDKMRTYMSFPDTDSQ